MEEVFVPEGYENKFSLLETKSSIKKVKDFFERDTYLMN